MGVKNKITVSKITESRNFGLLLGLAVLLILAAVITPSMYSLNSILNMLQNNAVYGLLAIGEMMIILTGGIDISIGATLSLSGVVCCRLMAENPGVPGAVWVLLALVIGGICGAFNGLLVGYFKILPSEMQSFMPATADDDAFESVCPYMMLWDVIHLGAVAGGATYAAVNDGFDGKVGSAFEMDAFRDYDAETFEAYQSGDGTAVLAGAPYIFYKDNMEEWVDVL